MRVLIVRLDESGNYGLRKGIPENRPSVMNSIKSEWRALYTTQKTQKAKKYHDGVLRLLDGAFDRKIVLYDDSEKQLDSRYLKKDEVVKCGETLTFDGYLVDIGDLEENQTEESGSRKSAAPDNCTNVQNNLKKELMQNGMLYTPHKKHKKQKSTMMGSCSLWLVFPTGSR
ncbi:hypothetical protein AQUCO_03700242v1 [Aquilegia coerulea]|uniref:5'-3' DNA helicase ZGRF1-like N-terminal domain-containing protein n=1 Tax=Aquilegia coerulea TaxID=218851 RepID=A0A2G5CU63_AQUCA|nr:hypothetical protein AQUCO_03700242v1 [Aquilegia coerulea]